MASTRKIKIEGLKELNATLEKLPEAISNEILTNAFLSAGNQVMVPAIRGAMAPYSATAKQAVLARSEVSNPPVVVAGVTNDAFWVMWADQGTVDRYVRGDKYRGAYRGSISGAHKIQPAIYVNVDKVTDIIAGEIQKELEKYLLSKGAEKA